MNAPTITWDGVEPGTWISTGWGAQHRVRSLSDTHVVLASHGAGPDQHAEKSRVNLNADETHRCSSCERAGGPDGLGPARPGVVGEVRRTPEGWVAVHVAKTSGSVTSWRFVGDSPLGSHGWAPDSFMGNAVLIAVIPGTPAADVEALVALLAVDSGSAR